MKQCPSCKIEVSDELALCPFDGHELIVKRETAALINILLDDKYRLEEKAGEGGMGAVYRATHVQMEHTVAVKILHPHLASDSIAVERFRREARAAAQIRHPNAVAVTDFGVTKDANIAYLVMEFLEGQDLKHKIKQEKQLDYEQAYWILNQACAAVDAAHAKGIIHRDLKPDNIWLVKTGDAIAQVKVLDFGIAKLKTATEAAGLTQKGMIVGTPYYMSPEQCRGEELDARSDLYSLGVILYEMLTGKVPFDGATPLAVVMKHNSERPRPLHDLRPGIPPEVEKVVLRALEKKREDRQESALQLAHELDVALHGAAAKPISPGAGASQPFNVRATAPHVSAHEAEIARTRAYDAGASAPYVPDATSALRGRGPTQAVQNIPTFPAGIAQPGAAQMTNQSSVAAEQSFSEPRVRPKSRTTLYAVAVIVVLLIAGAIVARIVLSGPPADNPTIPGVPPEMALIKGGTFMMGTDEATAHPSWRPAHAVMVSDFLLDLTEVTNEDYERFVKQTGRAAPPHWTERTFPKAESQFPVVNVSWHDAKAYAEWASKRLPTEAEWEYAARGSDNLIYPWGNQWSDALSNSGEDRRGGPVTVKSFPRGNSSFGIFDMAGNVAEWVADDFATYPGSSAKAEPGYKVYRGGSWSFPKEQLQTMVRWPDLATAKLKYVGFRCARDVPK